MPFKSHLSLFSFQDFFQGNIPLSIQNIEFLPSLIYENPSVEKKTKNYWKKNLFLYPERLHLGEQFSTQKKHGFFYRFSLRKGEWGYGLFAEEEIPPLTWVGIYTGVVKRKMPYMRNNPFLVHYPKGFTSFFSYVIDAAQKGNHTRFINHSPLFNSELKSIFFEGNMQMAIRTTAKVLKNSEITLDYGDKFWKELK